MAYFVEKREGKRKTSYCVQVIIKQNQRILHRESQSFSTYREANSWGARRDKELRKALEEDGELFADMIESHPSATVGDLIQRYRKEYSATYGRTVGKDLELLGRFTLARIPVTKLTSGDIVTHIKKRVNGGVSPATASNDLTRLQTVLDAAWASFDIPVPRGELEKARLECRRRRLVSKSKERNRIATEVELKKLCDHFNQDTRGSIPMSDTLCALSSPSACTSSR